MYGLEGKKCSNTDCNMKIIRTVIENRVTFFARNVRNNKVDHVCTEIDNLKKMPNTKSTIRRVRRVKKQTLVNKIRKSKYKKAVKDMELVLKSKDVSKAKKFFPKFQSILMQVAKSGVIDRKTAQRKILELLKELNSKVSMKLINLN